MTFKNRHSSKWQMMELPDGITTSNGLWYHITATQIDQYVPGLQKRTPLKQIIEQADVWVLSADVLSLLLYFFLAYLAINPLLAFIIAIFYYLLYYFNTSPLVSVQLSRLMMIISYDGFLYGLSAILLIRISLNTSILSTLSLDIDMSALWYGITLIFAFKVGLLRLLLKYLSVKFSKGGIERQDRILNMLLIRYGMYHGILTKSVNEMQNELIKIANYHKTKK